MNKYLQTYLKCFFRHKYSFVTIKRRCLLFVLLITVLNVTDGYGQFINVEINIEPEVNTTVEQSLDFGQAIAGSGMVEIPIGSPNMGIFQIRALRTQQLLISVEIDDDLIHEDPGIDTKIPMNLSANYTDNGVNDHRQSIPFGDELQAIIVNPPPQNPSAVWSSIFVFIYGDLNIGNVPIGTYHGEILLTVIYE